MKHSPLRHPVAVLRKLIGISQEEFAKLVGRSRRSIQAVELGSLVLSVDLAERIAHETGAPLDWLLDGDPSIEPRVGLGEVRVPYTKADFERTRATIAAGKRPDQDSAYSLEVSRSDDDNALNYRMTHSSEYNPLLRGKFDVLILRILASLCSANKTDRLDLASYRLNEFTEAIETEFGQSVNAEFCANSTEFLEGCLASVLTVPPIIEHNKEHSGSSHDDAQPWLGTLDFVSALWKMISEPEFTPKGGESDALIDASIQRMRMRKEFLKSIQEMTQLLLEEPPSQHSRKGDESPRSHAQ